MSVLALLVGCVSDELVVTGGGEVIVSLVGEGINDSFTVPGGSEDDLDELFADGHHPDQVVSALNVENDKADFAEGWHLQPNLETWVYVADNDVADFAPCRATIRHAELFFELVAETGGVLQLDGRPPDDPTLGDDGATPPSLVSTPDEDAFRFDESAIGLYGTNSTSVDVQCPSGPVSATLSVRWEFDEHVRRRAHEELPAGTTAEL